MHPIVYMFLVFTLICSAIVFIWLSVLKNKIKKEIKSLKIKLEKDKKIVINCNKKINTYKDIEKILEECGKPNWDGCNSSELKLYSMQLAMSLLGSLSNELNQPEVSINPDGEICLDWFSEPKNTLFISFGLKGMSYYFVLNEEKDHGIIEYEYNNPIPEKILEMIKKL